MFFSDLASPLANIKCRSSAFSNRLSLSSYLLHSCPSPHFPLTLKDGHTPLTLIFSFLATRRRCFLGVVLCDGSGGGVRCAFRNKRFMNAVPAKEKQQAASSLVEHSQNDGINHCLTQVAFTHSPASLVL